MTIEKFDHDSTRDPISKYRHGQKMHRFTCNNCTDYVKVLPTSAGYQNAFAHLNSKKCYGTSLQSEFWKIKADHEQIERSQATDAKSKRNHQKCIETSPFAFSAETKSLFDYIRLFVFFGMSFGIVESEMMRDILKNPPVKTTKIVVDTMHFLVHIVEQKISLMMKSAPCGQTLHDGCTINSQHYMGVFVAFSREVSVRKDNKTVKENKVELRLIGCAPPPPLDDDSLATAAQRCRQQAQNDDDAEATEFTAQVQLDYLRFLFQQYDVDYDKWVVTQCADNAPVNIATANLTGMPHIPCQSHCFALAGQTLLTNDNDLGTLVEDISSVSGHIRGSIKVSAAVRNHAARIDHRLANISAKPESETRKWFGMTVQLRQHLKLIPAIRECANNRIARMREYIGTTEVSFMDRVTDHLRYLNPMRAASEFLQTHKLPVYKCLQVSEYIRTNVENKSGVFQDCQMDTT